MTNKKKIKGISPRQLNRRWLLLIPAAKKLWWWGHVRLPHLIPAPHPRPNFRNPARDKQINTDSEIPQGETASVMAIWGTEAYGPAEIERLYTGLESLGWDINELPGTRLGSVEWIKRQRNLGSEGSYNIGLVQQHGKSQFLSSDHFTELPMGIDYLLVELHQICPSLTCLNIGFVFNPSIQHVYEDQLNLDRSSTRVPIKNRFGAYRIIDPHHHKQAAISSQRAALQSIVSGWFKNNVPGIFCGTSSVSLPTAELILTRRESLFEPSEQIRKSFRSWPNSLLGAPFGEAWKSTQHNALIFGPRKQSDEIQPHLVISLPTESLSEDTMRAFGGQEPYAYVQLVHDQLSGILVRFAVLALLNLFRKNLMQTRDQLQSASPSKHNILRLLDYIQSFFSASIQIPSIVGEILNLTEKKYSYKFYCDGFIEVNPFRDEPAAMLYERLSDNTFARANRLLQDDRITRETFKQISEVVTARESVNAQRRMEVLTWIAIVVAALSLWIALPPLPEWNTRLRGLYQTIIREPLPPHTLQR